MGRPLNKRNFKHGEGNQLAITAKVEGVSENEGFVIEQTGSSRYIVNVDGTVGTVYLVDKDAGDLEDGEGIIELIDVDGAAKRVKKLLAHRALFFDSESAAWSFEPATATRYQAIDVDVVDVVDDDDEEEDDVVDYVITIVTQPEDADGMALTSNAVVSVEAEVEPEATLEYQWQTNGEGGWDDLSDANEIEGSNTDTLTFNFSTIDPGFRGTLSVRCVITVAGTETETVSDSAVVTLRDALQE